MSDNFMDDSTKDSSQFEENLSENGTSLVNSYSGTRPARNRKRRTFDNFYLYDASGSVKTSTPHAYSTRDRLKNTNGKEVADGNSVFLSPGAALSDVVQELSGGDTDGGDSSHRLFVSAAPSKKKRGRPFKIKLDVGQELSGGDAPDSFHSNDGEDSSHRSKKNRGRPRKIELDSNPSIDYNKYSPESSHSQRKRKSEDDCMNNSSLEGDSDAETNSFVSLEKRGRGRPKKLLKSKGTVDNEGENSMDCSSQRNESIEDGGLLKRGRGKPLKAKREKGRLRPRKSVECEDQEYFTDTNESSLHRKEERTNEPALTNSTVRRGKGRPRKTVGSETGGEDTDEYEFSLDKNPLKRGKGRPRKIMKSEMPSRSAVETVLNSSSVKRGRGRPKRTVGYETLDDNMDENGSSFHIKTEMEERLNESVDATSLDRSKTKRGRGRPKKNVGYETSDDMDENEFAFHGKTGNVGRPHKSALSNSIVKRGKGRPRRNLDKGQVRGRIDFLASVGSSKSSSSHEEKLSDCEDHKKSFHRSRGLRDGQGRPSRRNSDSMASPGPSESSSADQDEFSDDKYNGNNLKRGSGRVGRGRQGRGRVGRGRGGRGRGRGGRGRQGRGRGVRGSRSVGRGSGRRKSLESNAADKEDPTDDEYPVYSSTMRHPSNRGRRGKGKGNYASLRIPTGEIKCVHCESLFTTTSTYKFHLMSKHSLVCTVEHPEGVDDGDLLLKLYGQANCPKCGRSFKKNVCYFRHHKLWCGREREVFFCEVCEKDAPLMWKPQHMRAHVKQEEVRAQAEEQKEAEPEVIKMKSRRKAADSALSIIQKTGDDGDDNDGVSDGCASFHSSEDDDDEEVGAVAEAEDDGGDAKLKNSYLPKRTRVSWQVWREFCTLSGIVPKGEKIRLLYEFYHVRKEGFALFPEWGPDVDQWKTLSSSDREKYLPPESQSPVISVGTDHDKNPETFSLKMGEGRCVGEKLFCYTGGPIWASEWCPLTSLSVIQDQILAVASDAEPGPNLVVGKLCEGPNLLQFWSVGLLDTNSKEAFPKLEFCIAHDDGFVRSLAWCPKGHVEKMASNGENNGKRKHSDRLGLLAVACSNSTIPIYCIPKLSSVGELLQSTSSCKNPIIVKPKPCLRLVPISKNDATPCISVAWQNSDECQFIIGGYGRGEVMMWRLGSPFSPSSNGTTKELRPVRCFFHHRVGVNSLSWCPSLPHQFISCDYNGDINAWDTGRPQEPEFTVKSTNVLIPKAICWIGPLHWGFFSANDRTIMSNQRSKLLENYILNFHGMSSRCLMHPDFQETVAVHRASLWDVTFDPVFNTLVSCDTKGNVLVSLPDENKLLILRGLKTYSFPHITGNAVIYNTSCTNESSSSGSPENGCNSTSDPVTNEDPSCQKEAFTLRFTEVVRDNSTLAKPQSPNVLRSLLKTWAKSSCLESISNMEAIHRVRLCPNMGSTLWLASGGKAGVLRFDNLTDIVLPHSWKMKMLMKELWEKTSNKEESVQQTVSEDSKIEITDDIKYS